MRSFLIIIFLFHCTWITMQGQNPYNATTASYNGAQKSKISSFAKGFKYLPMANWTPGMRFMVVPDRMKLESFATKLELVPYRSRKSAVYVGIDQREFEWQEFTFVQVEQRKAKCGRSTCKYCFIVFEAKDGRRYEYPYPGTIEELRREKGLAFVNSLIYLDDIDNAKRKLVGKKMYLLRHDRNIENQDGRKLYTSDKKFVEVTITNVGVGSRLNPVRVIYKESNGKEYYSDVTLSGINSSNSPRITWFDDVFTMTNPKGGYPSISSENWTWIQEGQVKIGMTKEECILAWGEPNKINDSILIGENMEQWVYKRNFLYFEDGLLSSIQGYE